MKGKQADLDWYELAVKFEALYQEEVLAHERALTNWSCFSIESEEKLRQAADLEHKLRDELKKSNQNLEDGLQIMKNLEQELIQAHQQSQDVHHELEEKNHIIQDLQRQVDEMQRNVAKIETSAKKAKAEAKVVMEKNEELQSKIHYLETELEEKEALCDTIQDQLLHAKEENEHLLEQISEFENKEEQLMKEKEDDEANLNVALDEVNVLEAKISAMESEHERAIAQVEADYLRDIDERCAEIVPLQNDLVKYKQENSQLKDEMQVCKTESDRLRQQVEEHDRYKTNEQYMSKLRVAEKKLLFLEENEVKLKSTEKLLEEYKTQNMTLHEKIRSVLTESSRDHQHWANMEKKFRADIHSLQEQLSDVHTHNRNLANKCSNYESSLKILQLSSSHTSKQESGPTSILSDSAALKKFMRDRKIATEIRS